MGSLNGSACNFRLVNISIAILNVLRWLRETLLPTELPIPCGYVGRFTRSHRTGLSVVALLPAVLGFLLACSSGAPSTPSSAGAQTPETATSPAAAQTSRTIEARSSSTAKVGRLVGDRVPSFTMRVVDGSRVTSTSLLSGDKPVFLYFFATW